MLLWVEPSRADDLERTSLLAAELGLLLLVRGRIGARARARVRGRVRGRGRARARARARVWVRGRARGRGSNLDLGLVQIDPVALGRVEAWLDRVLLEVGVQGQPRRRARALANDIPVEAQQLGAPA